MKYASLCVLSFERLRFLQECVSSAIARAEAPFELIVHDDGSEDRELRQWLFEMSNEGVISTLLMNSPGWNEGQGIAMNRMAAVATGDPIIKCDQDIIFKQGWLRKVNETLESNCGCEEDSPPMIGALGLFRYEAEPVRYEDMLLADHGNWEEHRDFVGSVVVMPRNAWNIFGPWGTRSTAFAEDNIFKLGIAKTEGWCCALTKEELAVNQGFGVGPSTLVLGYGPDDVRSIKPGPLVIE